MNRSDYHSLAMECLASAKLGRNGWYRATCRFCPITRGTPDPRWSWGYLPEEGKWHCFRCGVFGFFGEAQGKDYAPPVKEERELDPELGEASRLPSTFELIADTTVVIDDLFGASLDPYQPVREFLKKRGVSRALAREVGIGVCLRGCKGSDPSCTPDTRCMACRFRNRIIIPVKVQGEQLGFVARTWRKTAMVNYLYPKGMPRGRTVFNHAALERETDEPVMVCEGVFDALPYWPDAVACLGKPTEDQLDTIAGAKRPIVVTLDGDAWREAKIAGMLLEQMGATRVGWVKLPPCRDPNEVDPKWLREQARASLQH